MSAHKKTPIKVSFLLLLFCS